MNLRKIVQGVGAQVNTFDHGKTFASVQQQGQPQQQQPPQNNVQFQSPLLADYTFNPNPNTNIPYSTHDPAQAHGPAELPRQGSLRVMTSLGGMQPSGLAGEDDYTPAAALETTGYFNPQTTLYGYKQQDARQPAGNFMQAQDSPERLRRLLGF